MKNYLSWSFVKNNKISSSICQMDPSIMHWFIVHCEMVWQHGDVQWSQNFTMQNIDIKISNCSNKISDDVHISPLYKIEVAKFMYLKMIEFFPLFHSLISPRLLFFRMLQSLSFYWNLQFIQFITICKHQYGFELLYFILQSFRCTLFGYPEVICILSKITLYNRFFIALVIISGILQFVDPVYYNL